MINGINHNIHGGRLPNQNNNTNNNNNDEDGQGK